ncbi:hypothetical protein BN8_03774 [Fibrisoma limi BUZ 3]|uniref:Peptidase M4 C-terminal domain-containing protein n=1 Tax=Fibrisoma limi BUZ 3 TaxID=1185876 RepID=I2GL14_9BACT|nr:hypothetical protein [Fibrisoma limi]CCH54590.1 hypothetical protein BN8_03774 [Fibrisoma limi BUZ 3]
MSVKLDVRLESVGTRFRLFPQPRFLSAFQTPETVYISVPPEEIKPGPADNRMIVIDAINKLPYSRFFRPPYIGAKNPPVQPSSDGHFDHLDIESREFSCATMYATVRRVLDIWEDYFGHQIEWHFEADFSRLELIPLIEWNNAQSGYGFLEFGYGRSITGGIDRTRPYCQNFDVLAHEIGHSIIFSKIGVPENSQEEHLDFWGMHESAGDLVAIVASLHFDTVITYILNKSCGNLFTVNELDRVGELSESREIRIAFNYKRMSDVGAEPHDRSVPLTGGIFDVFVEVFQKELVNNGLITQALADLSNSGPNQSQDLSDIQNRFAAAYKGNEAGFKDALLFARDYLGQLLAITWSNLSPNHLTYHTILRGLLRADRQITNGEHQDTIRTCFAWREISLIPGSLLLRPHTVQECGLTAGPDFVDGLIERLNQKDPKVIEALQQILRDKPAKKKKS